MSAQESHHLIVTAAEFARQNPASMTAQLIVLLQLDGFQAQVDNVGLNLEAAIARAAAAGTDRLGAWANQLDKALDALFEGAHDARDRGHRDGDRRREAVARLRQVRQASGPASFASYPASVD